MNANKVRSGTCFARLRHAGDRSGIDRNDTLVVLIVLALLLVVPGPAGSREVTIEHNGLTLNANLEMVNGKSFGDGVVLILHGFWGQNIMEIVATSRVLPFVDGKRIHLHVIEGAGHFFRDFNIDEAMEHVLEFLQETGGI